MFQDVVYAVCAYFSHRQHCAMFQDTIPWLSPLHRRSTEIFESSKTKRPRGSFKGVGLGLWEVMGFI